MCTMRLITAIDVYNEAQRLRFNGDLDGFKDYITKYKEMINYVSKNYSV